MGDNRARNNSKQDPNNLRVVRVATDSIEMEYIDDGDEKELSDIHTSVVDGVDMNQILSDLVMNEGDNRRISNTGMTGMTDITCATSMLTESDDVQDVEKSKRKYKKKYIEQKMALVERDQVVKKLQKENEIMKKKIAQLEGMEHKHVQKA